jgi:hypothetical protein
MRMTFAQFQQKHVKIKAFDSPYLFTMGAENGGWVRYQLLPASMSGHRVNLVYHSIEVNPDEPPMEIWEDFFHCIHCKLMGTKTTMQEYSCDSERKDGKSLGNQ